MKYISLQGPAHVLVFCRQLVMNLCMRVFCSQGHDLTCDFNLLCRIGRKWAHGGLLIVSSFGCLAWTVLHLLGEWNILWTQGKSEGTSHSNSRAQVFLAGTCTGGSTCSN